MPEKEEFIEFEYPDNIPVRESLANILLELEQRIQELDLGILKEKKPGVRLLMERERDAAQKEYAEVQKHLDEIDQSN